MAILIQGFQGDLGCHKKRLQLPQYKVERKLQKLNERVAIFLKSFA
jgi:hypothetical protein